MTRRIGQRANVATDVLVRGFADILTPRLGKVPCIMSFVFSVVFALLPFISGAVAPIQVAGSVSLMFEDSSTDLRSLANNPTIMLPLHATALYYGIDCHWDPARRQIVLSKDGAEAKVVLGNQHALIDESKLRPLSTPPVLMRGAVALPPHDIAHILSDLLPHMDVSWDEAEATIGVKKKANRARRPESAPDPSNGNFLLKTIIIDPGHGGYDPGAVKGDSREKDIVLDVASRLSKLIDSRSAWEVVVTRDSDEFVSLKQRTEIADKHPGGNTILISIHCNASRSTSARGLETFVFDLEATDAEAAALARRENADEKMDLAYILSHCYRVGSELYGLELAEKVQASLAKRTKMRNRGIKRAPFYVLAGAKMPAILVELGFISNYYDRKNLHSASFRQSAAEALFDAISDFDRSAATSLAKAD